MNKFCLQKDFRDNSTFLYSFHMASSTVTLVDGMDIAIGVTFVQEKMANSFCCNQLLQTLSASCQTSYHFPFVLLKDPI